MPAIRPGVIHKILLAFFRKCCYNSISPISDFIKKRRALMHKELQRIRHGYYDLWFGTNAVYERWAKSHGLNNNLLLTLYLLKEFPNDCTQHLICEKLMLPKQTVNSILSGLEDKGFVEKIISPTDKRVKLLVFTSQGAAYADGLLQKMDDFEERALRNMTDAQRNALLEGGFAWMKALRDAIDD
jgi:DNA-binding MarR family transcriptional regulator